MDNYYMSKIEARNSWNQMQEKQKNQDSDDDNNNLSEATNYDLAN